MIFSSPRPQPIVPKTDILSYIFDGWKHDWDKPLYIDAENPSTFLTASQLLDLAKRIGCGLRESAGINTGDVVLLSAANSILIPPLMLGVICAGAMLTGANPTFTSTELEFQINDAGPKAIFATEETLEIVLLSVKSLNLPTSMVHLITLEKGPKKGTRTLGDLTDHGTMDWERLENEKSMRDRIVLLNYSSGTTGLPKGCVITVFNIIAQCEQHQMIHDIGRRGLRAQGRPIQGNDVVLAYMPFYHAFAQQTYIINGARNGDTIYVMASFSFPALLKHIPTYRVTSLDAVPPVIVLLAKDPAVRKTDFGSMHSVLSGAAPLGAETQTQAEAAINTFSSGNVKIQQGWGMTEAVCGICKFALHERDPDISGVGYLYPGMTARIVPVDDPSYSESLGFNQEGEVLVKGPNIFAGYWRRKKETQDAFTHDGWYKTGDIGVVKEGGIMHIVDRKKELIKVRGLQVAPAELESFLVKSPDVGDAAIIGIPGEGTEHPRAYVVPSIHKQTDDPDSLQSLAHDIQSYVASGFAKHKHLSGGIVFVESIPKSPSGKILRRQLRDRSKAQSNNDRVWLSELVGKSEVKEAEVKL